MLHIYISHIACFSNTMTIPLQTAPELFSYETFSVTDSKVQTDVHFPDAAYIVASCMMDTKTNQRE